VRAVGELAKWRREGCSKALKGNDEGERKEQNPDIIDTQEVVNTSSGVKRGARALKRRTTGGGRQHNRQLGGEAV